MQAPLIRRLRAWVKLYRQAGYFDALKIALIYGAFAAFWIIFSDRFIELIASDAFSISELQTIKGLLFVLVTTVLVGVLSYRSLLSQNRLIKSLQDNRHRLNLILNTVPCGILENDVNGRMVYSNRAHHDMLGWAPGTLVGQNIWDLQPDEAGRAYLRDYLGTLVRERPHPETLITRNRTATGEIIDLEVVWDYHFNQDDELTGFISIVTDITERKKQEQKILHLAHYDTLTELPNRFLSLDRLSNQIKATSRDKEQVAVLFMDLDNFKKINDSLGHETGDLLLKQAANRLRSRIRDGDTVGRLGGDEFIVLLGNLQHTDDATVIVHKLLAAFRKPFNLAGRELMMTVSVGVAIYPDDASDASQLLRHADMAMFHAKDNGRNTFAYFSPTMTEAASRRLIIEEQLQFALMRDELSVVYQPQIAMADGHIIAAEALLRWRNPELGFVSPDEFIRVAEQTGQIIEIGKFVIEQALHQLKHWQQWVPDCRIAINLSPSQFRDPGLLDFVREAIERHQLSDGMLEFEITEGVLLSGYSFTHEVLTQLSESGVHLAMDDFGTGYSSLSYLRNYPFDLLKIDRVFINDMHDNPADYELIQAILAMAKGLGLKVVAEGVETAEQAQALMDSRCDYAQGYFYSKPVPPAALCELLQKQASEDRAILPLKQSG